MHKKISTFRNDLKTLLALYSHKQMISIALIGFSSGLPLFLTASTLALWLQNVGISLTNISIIGLVTIPYSLKFLWAPFIDCLKIPILSDKIGHKKSWLLFSQILLLISILGIASTNPEQNIIPTICWAMMISFAAATQEIIMLAYQAHCLEQKQYGAGEAVAMLGYRIGMLFSGAGALYLAEYMSWQQVYQSMAGISVIGILTSLYLREPHKIIINQLNNNVDRKKNTGKWHKFIAYFRDNILYPFQNFLQRPNCYIIICIMVSYKLCDNLMGNMSNLFYAYVGFSKLEIANASKIFGMIATIIGGFLGSFVIHKFGILKSLIITILIHGLSILMFLLIHYYGHNQPLFYCTVALEHITGGMRTTALLSFQLTLINARYATTQLAIFTSLAHFSRTIVSTFSGWIIDNYGWVNFFVVCSSSTVVSVLFVLLFVSKNCDLQINDSNKTE